MILGRGLVPPLVLAIAVMAAAPAAAQDGGETLRFRMYWGILPVGRAVLTSRIMELGDAGSVSRFELNCRSNLLVDLICKVRDHLASTAAADLSRSLAYNKTLHEGSARRDFATIIAWPEGRSFLRDLLDNSTLARNVPDGVLDPLSVFYAFRRTFLNGGEAASAPVTDGLYTVTASARLAGRENVRVPCGEFPARKVQVCMPLVDGIFRASEPGCYFVWISDDGRGLPLKIQAKVRVAGFLGDLSVELAGVEGAWGQVSGSGSSALQ